MATKPKAILSTHDGREASPITKASNVLFENGQTAQDILNDRQDAMISPVIENSSSMFKVGQGDNVDYSANVVNGAYESVVLKGKSMVNCIQEPSSQDVVLPYEFEEGQYVTINDTKETGALGVELKGQTLVNLVTYKNFPYTSNELNNDFRLEYELKTNTVYTVAIDIDLNGIEPDTIGLGFLKAGVDWASNTIKYVAGLNKIKLTTKDLIANYLRIRGNGIIINYAVVLEGDYTNIDIPYFEGMQSVQVPSVKTVGKNLFDGEFELDKYLKEDGTLGDSANWATTKNYISVRPNTTYTQNIRMHSYIAYVFFYDKNKNIVGAEVGSDVSSYNSASYTTPNNCYYIKTCYDYSSVGNHLFQLEESTTPTTYEPYKSTTLTTPEEITLRGIGNVKDTLNTVTGEYVQRIGEIVLDGRLIPTINQTYTTQNHLCFEYYNIAKGKIYDQSTSLGLISDKLTSRNWISFYSSKNDEEGVVLNRDSGVILNIKMKKTNFTTLDSDGVKQYLSENPITVQYELATPITKKVDLTFTNQDNQPTTKLSTYNTTTHINASSQEGSLIPTLSHVNPSYPVILKPSTKYSIVADSYSNNHTNSAINFNLGGATVSTTVGNRVSTVTTPGTLTSEKLVMSGRGNMLNNVMVIEGDVVGDESYFEGICDSKSPILSNVGKNLFDGESRVGYYDTDKGTYVSTPTMKQCCNTTPIQVSGGTKYSFLLPEGDMGSGRTFLYDSKMKFITSIINADVRYVITTTQNTKYINFHFDNATPELLSKVQLEEGSATTTYEPYKSNILSANGDKVELTEDMFEQGAFGYIGGTTREDCVNRADASLKNYRIRSKQLIKINPNASYRILISNKDYMVGLQGFDDKQISIGYDTYWKSDDVITTPSNMHYCNILIKKSNDKTITPSDFDNANIEIREIDKTIVLRSLPNGTCDTLNVETGEYVQRIGEVVLDGSEQGWILGTSANWYADGDTFGFYFNHFKLAQGTSLCIDKFLSTPNIHTNDIEGCYISTEWSWVGVRIYKTKLPSLTVDAFKQWLSQNHITIQYRLATPIIKTVDLSGYPFSYENGHVVLSSGSIEQSLTPKVEYSVATNRNGQIRSNQKMVERHQKQLDQLQAIILANLVNSQYNQTLTTLKYELSRV